MSNIDRNVGRYLRTVANLQPSQIAQRLRLRAQRALLSTWPAPFERRWTHREGEVSWPSGFVAVDAIAPPSCGSPDDLERGALTFLNETRELGNPMMWDPPDASQLWLYHLHYWEWAWTLLAYSDRERSRSLFTSQLNTWLEQTRFGRWNAWAPYPASVRAWVFVNVERDLVRGTPAEPKFHHLLRLHAGFIEHNLELDVGGNHLIKNLKALIGLGVFFNDSELIAKARRLLTSQLDVQILADGGHFELSPSYHSQVLGDLIDIQSLANASAICQMDAVDDAVTRMRRWLGMMLMPDGDVPLFNDGELVGVDRLRALQPGPLPSTPLTVLADSGYVVARPGDRFHLVADVGRPGPRALPAHAHADCLTFELAVDGRRVVVDPGTSIYGTGPRRQWERGTPAHSTLTVDGADQTEVWANFRAGRLATPTLEEARSDGQGVRIRASHDGYATLRGSPVHTRTWSVNPRRIEITDTVEGKGTHRIGSRILLNAAEVEGHDGAAVTGAIWKVSLTCDQVTAERRESAVRIVDSERAIGQGAVRAALALDGSWLVALPVQFTTIFEVTSEASNANDSGPS